MKKVAIYTRKSIYIDNSESITAQLNTCEDYVKNNFKDYTILKFVDEGYSGANTKRPAFSELEKQIKMNIIDVVVCYRIDRISRSVLDFSRFFSVIEEKNIEFVSVTEKIDTNTPTGRAMMYISSVFGQMEREAISERVRDTLIDMVRRGFWCGGKAPIGYKAIKIRVGDKEHKSLEVNPDTIDFYKLVVKLFVEENLSIGRIVTHLRHKGITTSPNSGALLSTNYIYEILTNPAYVQADNITYDYFKNKGCNMLVPKEKFDGTKALIRWGRHGEGSKHILKKINEWNISVGLHDYIITSDIYMQIVSRFGINKLNLTRKNKIGIVHNILKCKCGQTMRAKTIRGSKVYTYYICRQKHALTSIACNMPAKDLKTVDNAIINILKNISLDKNLIDNYVIKPSVLDINRTEQDVEKEISMIKNKIDNLINNLSLSETASKYLLNQIEILDKNLNSLKIELEQIRYTNLTKKQNEVEKEDKYIKICELVENIENIDYDVLQNMLRDLLKECYFDDEEKLHIKI